MLKSIQACAYDGVGNVKPVISTVNSKSLCLVTKQPRKAIFV